MPTKNQYCSFCGVRFVDGLGWPRTCAACKNTSYINPLPVGVALVSIGKGLLVVRRAIPPKIGELALPGGFIDVGESWRTAIARELFEETGITTAVDRISFFESLSSPGGHLLIFGCCQAIPHLPDFTPNSETQELAVLSSAAELAFPLHTEVVARYFDQK